MKVISVYQIRDINKLLLKVKIFEESLDLLKIYCCVLFFLDLKSFVKILCGVICNLEDVINVMMSWFFQEQNYKFDLVILECYVIEILENL